MRGYTGSILRVDLSSGRTCVLPTEGYAAKYIGGRGIAAKIYWDEVPPDVGALDPGNKLMLFTGPLAGFSGLGGSRWVICGKSPAASPERFSYANLGGNWGIQLKAAGYDGMVIQGKASRPVYLLVKDGSVAIKDAGDLWGRSTVEVRSRLKEDLGKGTCVAACGPAGENLVSFATVHADNDASGSSGFGAVMGSKNLKAIAVSGKGRVRPARPDNLRELTGHVRRLKMGPEREQPFLQVDPRVKKDVCRGCIGACIRQTFQARDGTKGKYTCTSGWFYQERALRYYGEWNEVPFFATRLCDNYGIDASSIDAMIMWLSRCEKAGVLNDENTGIPLSRLGSLEFIETLVKRISAREGFGEVLSHGIARAAEAVGQGAGDLITDYWSKAGHHLTYCPRMYLLSSLLWAIEPRQPIQQLHEIGSLLYLWLPWAMTGEGSFLTGGVFRNIARKFWGSELAVDFTTYEGKAVAATKIQDREYAKESLVLCDWMWPISYVEYSDDHVGDPTVESRLFSAVTGMDVSEQDLYHCGERIFNLQRAVLAREGHRGRPDDILAEAFHTRPLKSDVQNPECLAPGENGATTSRKGAVVEKDKFEELKDEYYRLRGWDARTGLQTESKLRELGLSDVAADLARRNRVR